MYTRLRRHPLVALSLGALLACASLAQAQSVNTFNYQGRIDVAGAPLSDTADFEFTLWDAPVDGSMIGSVVALNNVDVVNGLFAVDLNTADEFGPSPFDGVNLNMGGSRWLEIAVRSPAGAGAFTTLAPRQKIDAAPFALQTRGMFFDQSSSANFGPSSLTGFKVNIDSQSGQGSLLLQSSSTIGTRFRLNNTSDEGRVYDLISTGPGNANGSGKLLFVDSSGGGPRIAIDEFGRVGINTTTPTNLLSVNGNSSFVDSVGIGVIATDPNWRLDVQGLGAAARFNSGNTYGTTLRMFNASSNQGYDVVTSGLGNPDGSGQLLIRNVNNNTTLFRVDQSGVIYSNGSYRQNANGFFQIDAPNVIGGRVSVLLDGRVGIGTANPKERLHVNGAYYGWGDFRLHALEGDGANGTAYIQARDTSGASNIGMILRSQQAGTVVNAIQIASNGIIGIGGPPATDGFNMVAYQPAGQTWAFYAAGLAGGNQPWNNTSDARYKTNVTPMDGALDTLLELRGVTFDWDRAGFPDKQFPDGNQVGFIAQEVQNILPQVVQARPDGDLGIAYSAIVPVIVQGVQEQQSQIDALAIENRMLRAELEELRAVVKGILARD